MLTSWVVSSRLCSTWLWRSLAGPTANSRLVTPRWVEFVLTEAQISKEELLNPIKQDIKKGKIRFVRNCFPHKGYLWNYGCFPQVRFLLPLALRLHMLILTLPQTWEDPNTIHPETKAKGDNDPLDVCEIGELVAQPGQVKRVKVLGIMALLDEEETDWKVIVIDEKDPLAPKLNGLPPYLFCLLLPS